MAEEPSTSKQGFSADWLLRGVLTKLGDTFDRFTGRKFVPSSSLATSELIEAMKRLIDSETKEVPGKGKVAPHNIKLKMQWDKFSTDADASLRQLQNELLAAAVDHINDSLYYTFAPLKLEVKPDYFTEGVRLFVSFDKFDENDSEGEIKLAVPTAGLVYDENLIVEAASPSVETYIARFALRGSRSDRKLELKVGDRISVGRASNNNLVIDDISISKIHASLLCNSDGDLLVADTGSTNGTFINDQRISYGKATKLERTDRVKFGSIEVIFERITPEAVAKPEPTAEIGSRDETFAIKGMTFTSRNSKTVLDLGPMVSAKDKTLELETPVAKEDVPTEKGVAEPTK